MGIVVCNYNASHAFSHDVGNVLPRTLRWLGNIKQQHNLGTIKKLMLRNSVENNTINNTISPGSADQVMHCLQKHFEAVYVLVFKCTVKALYTPGL